MLLVCSISDTFAIFPDHSFGYRSTQRFQLLMQQYSGMHAVAGAAGSPSFQGSDPITAALEAHGMLNPGTMLMLLDIQMQLL